MKMNFKQYIKEENTKEFHKDIITPRDWIDFSRLSELYPGYTPGCRLIGNFDSYCKQLKSLEGSPSYVKGSFECDGAASLTTLEGMPTEIGNDFSCRYCKGLTNLKGSPIKVGNDLDAYRCKGLISLEGAPNYIGGSLDLSDCSSLVSLKGIGKQYLQSIGEFLILDNCINLKSNVLGICLIKLLNKVYINHNMELEEILDNHLQGDILECQEELITNGYKEYAKL